MPSKSWVSPRAQKSYDLVNTSAVVVEWPAHLFNPWPRLVPFRAAAFWHVLWGISPLRFSLVLLLLFSDSRILMSKGSLLQCFGGCYGFIWTSASANHESRSLICPTCLAWGWHKEKLYFFYSRSIWTWPTLPIYFIPSKINTVKAPAMIKGTLLTHVLHQANLFSICLHILKRFQGFTKARSPVGRRNTDCLCFRRTHGLERSSHTLWHSPPVLSYRK